MSYRRFKTRFAIGFERDGEVSTVEDATKEIIQTGRELGIGNG